MIKLLGKTIGAALFSLLSPSWILLNRVLEGFFNLKYALSGPQELINELEYFSMVVRLHPNEVIYSLLPKLTLILIGSVILVLVISHVCEKIIHRLSNQIRVRLLPQLR